MPARDRWQTLQAQLTTARHRLEAGDRAGALHAVEAALALDPDFLAAHALRDRIRSLPLTAPVAPVPAAGGAPPVAQPPLISTERYASFEQRTKRRRVDRQLDAARTALAQHRLREAETALEEVQDLDPNVPELSELNARLAAMRSRGSSVRPYRWIAAAAAFVLALAGASWFEESRAPASRSFFAPIPVAQVEPSPAPVTETDVPLAPLASPVPTAGKITPAESALEPEPEPEPVLAPPARPIDLRDSVTAAIDRRPIDPVVPTAVPPPPARTVPPPPVRAMAEPIAPAVSPAVMPAVATPPEAPAESAAPPTLPSPPPPATVAAPAPSAPASVAPVSAPAAMPASAAMAVVNDEALVKQTLQRYRRAYDGLDARSARAVWPKVNEAALARAFGSLESQSLTFDGCDVDLKGEAAAAICHGSARYVPKVGSHEPRVEPRTWKFTLRKDGADWKIESALAQR